ncbi:hypothetical protein F966_02982 [Acinetobacter higginsii]|uniref:DUF2793 domain-containing protein n=1 Tax=Acinetobacter higginsii TaxID=70347 RepID=N8XLJ3_9GAMM|nr:DUF2793 domain-containing protein [Acinetobacter higginsii]ENV08308.1 hypothetical protein F966_02982 [Acinetobacter higginsii]
MTFETDQRLGITRGYAHGQSGSDVADTLNQNFRLLSILLQASVKSATTTNPPTTPVDGDTYIVPAGSTGAWSTQIGKLTQYDKSLSGWIFITVNKGFSIFVDDVDKQWIYTSTGWRTVAFEP